jgi:ubiquinone/menaquinone biosynthesis C-methylase UbiE
VPRITDKDYLVSDQYQDASNLDARFELHSRFSANKQGWMQWVFDQLRFSSSSRILDLGCGSAHLWLENLGRIPTGWDITLSDLSPGMVREARENLNDSLGNFEYLVIDVQSIPFEAGSFDGVIANHMLYHVPNIETALVEIRRVLKPGGRFYSTTVGKSHLVELYDLVGQFAQGGNIREEILPEKFLLDNGKAVLSNHFMEVILSRYVDRLIITEAKPLIRYVQSMMIEKSVLSPSKLNNLVEFVTREISVKGSIMITKDSGMFKAVV